MKVDVLLGLQWGDEGKGKVVDVLTPKYDVVARFFFIVVIYSFSLICPVAFTTYTIYI